MKLIVVEDNDAVRSGLVRFLRPRALSVHAFNSAAPAVSALPVVRPDILLTDWDLREGGSGIQVARAARVYCPGIRIIMATGRQLAELRWCTRDMKIDAFLAKPFSLATLAQALDDSE